MTDIATGKPVPDFTAPASQGDVSLSALHGKAVVLFFYPKDNTPGCTTEAQGFRDHYAEFQKLGCEIIGISRDSLKSHANFTDKQNLPFSLISDTDEAVCTLFGVIKMKNMYGKQVRGIERSTFLVGPDGTLLREWRGVKVPGHVEQVLSAVREIS
jgi:peroxiredoxin Q/BCP